MPVEALRIFRLVPDAAESDPNWDLSPPAGEVIVRAHSAADARILAAEAEVDFLETETRPEYDRSTTFASAFRNERLYRVVEDSSGIFPREGPRTVLKGPARVDPLKRGPDPD